MTDMPPIVVLAGGLGTRLGPLTRNTPKSMVIVAGEPFIAHQLRLFMRQGIRHSVLCCGHYHEAILDFVGDGTAFGLKVEYSLDGEKLMGTGGALRRALPLLGDSFLVTYGDSYLDIAYPPIAEAFAASGKTGLMTVLHNEGRWDTSNVELQGSRIMAYSKSPTPKMHHIDYGLAVLNKAAFTNVPNDRPFDLSEIYQELITRHDMTVFEVAKRFYEVGSPAGLAETEAYLRR